MRRINFFLSLCCMLLLGTMNASAAIGDEIVYEATQLSVSSWCYDNNDKTQGQPENICDGNAGTFWHSNYGNSGATGLDKGGVPHWIIIDLGETKSIGGFGYQPRNTTSNGLAKAYKFYVSDVPFTDAAWGVTTPCTTAEERDVVKNLAVTPNSAGSWTWSTADMKNVALEAKAEGRYIMFVITESVGGFGNCAEFNVYAWSDDNKPALEAKIAEFQEAVTAGTGTAPGYKEASVTSAANIAISVAQGVVDNTSSTDAEEAEALANLETAIETYNAGAVIPITTGYYKIRSAYPGYYTSQSVYKSIYHDGNSLKWGTENDNLMESYWYITVADDKTLVENVVYGTYMNGCGALVAEADAQNVNFSWATIGQYNITSNGEYFHTGGHSNGAGVSGDVINYGSGVNIGNACAWELIPVTEVPYSACLTDAKNNAQTVIDGIADDAITTELFYYSQSKITALQGLIDAAVPVTNDEIVATYLELQKTTNTDLMNLPEDGKYFFKNVGRGGNHYLAFENDGGPSAPEKKAARSVWQLTRIDNGQYTLQNVLTGKYLQYADNSNWSLVNNAVVMKLFSAPNNAYGKVTIGGNGGNEKMHLRNSSPWKVMGYNLTDNASHWTIEAYEDNMAADLATAEETWLFGNAPAIANVLGLDASAYNTLTYDELFAGTTAEKNVYAEAAKKYYRINSAKIDINEKDAALGIDRTNDRPCGVTASSENIDAIWQFIPSGNGVKIYSPNYKKYIGAVKQTSSPMTDCAKMKVEGEGEVYSIVVVDETNKKFQFDGATCGNINMEGDNNSYVLDQWHEGGSHFTAMEAESVDIETSAAVEGEAYATAYLPFDVTVPTGDVKAFVGDAFTAGDTYISMTEAGAVKAENGFILKGTAAGNVTLSIGATDAKESALSGTLTEIETSDSYLVLGLTDNEVGFYKWSGATIAANKAFLNNTSGGAVKMLFGNGNVTGIGAIGNGESTIGNGNIYDLSGRVVNAPVKGGIYIKNGKKYIVK